MSQPLIERPLWNSSTKSEALLEAKQIAAKEHLRLVSVHYSNQAGRGVKWTQEPGAYTAVISWADVRPNWHARYAPRAAL